MNNIVYFNDFTTDFDVFKGRAIDEDWSESSVRYND